MVRVELSFQLQGNQGFDSSRLLAMVDANTNSVIFEYSLILLDKKHVTVARFAFNTDTLEMSEVDGFANQGKLIRKFSEGEVPIDENRIPTPLTLTFQNLEITLIEGSADSSISLELAKTLENGEVVRWWDKLYFTGQHPLPNNNDHPDKPSDQE